MKPRTTGRPSLAACCVLSEPSGLAPGEAAAGLFLLALLLVLRRRTASSASTPRLMRSNDPSAPRIRSFLVAALTLALMLSAACRSGGDEIVPDGPCVLQAGQNYPAKVISHLTTGEDNKNTDPLAAQGPPDCAYDLPNDLALGKGYVVFDLGCQLESHAGPEIKVWESDGSYCQAIAEPYEVYFSTDNLNYTFIGDGFGVTAFDAGSLAKFRYIKINAAGGIEGGNSPGPDIDAVEVFP
jgi:MYXO-CTERM domain-containing protein